MAKKKPQIPPRSNNEVRQLLLQFFYDRNKNSTSMRGKKGSAVKISDLKKALKEQHGLTQSEVQSNLTYLISQGWVEEQAIHKQIVAKGGTVIPSSTSYYRITAPGIDKIDGPGEFTMPKFHGVNIQATGQNVITLGDGNQVNAQFSDLGRALLDLRDAITNSNATEETKLGHVIDIETIQTQLAKPVPNKSIISLAWSSLTAAAAISGCADFVEKARVLITGLLA